MLKMFVKSVRYLTLAYLVMAQLLQSKESLVIVMQPIQPLQALMLVIYQLVMALLLGLKPILQLLASLLIVMARLV